nr:murein biosynthesis integral membrane protein MurJ [Thiocystis violacea]
MLASMAKVGSGSFLSRVLGFIRDLVVARVFGADAATDAFFVAFKIPNFARRLFAEGAFSAALVPILHEYREQPGLAVLKRFVDDMAGTLGAALLLLTALGILCAPILILAFAPGFGADASQFDLAVAMLRLTLPYLLFITLAAFAGSILNTYEHFGVPAFTPVLLNLILIGCALWLAPNLEQPILALAWGVLIAGLVQLAFLLPFLKRLGLLPRPRLNPRDPGVKRVFRQIGPAILGGSAGQISLLLNTLLASFLTTGSISWLYYADRLMEFPLGILAVALGTAIMPRLSQRHAARDPAAFSATLDWALRLVLLLGLPSAIGLLALSGPLMATLFHSAEFGGEDVAMAARGLMAYSLGVVAFMAIKVLIPGYYARQDIGTPVRIAMVALSVGLIANLVLMVPLGHAGLALGTTIAATVNAALLLRGLRREGIYRPARGWRRRLVQGLTASLAMGLLLSWGTGPTADWIAASGAERVWNLVTWILAGGLFYVAALGATGVRPGDLRP